jgi:hypothetical protein
MSGMDRLNAMADATIRTAFAHTAEDMNKVLGLVEMDAEGNLSRSRITQAQHAEIHQRTANVRQALDELREEIGA